MTQAEEHEALVEAVAYQHFLKFEGGSPEWSAKYWRDAKDAVHLGDCPHAQHKGPITCDRCVVDEHLDFVRFLLALIAERPTKERLPSAPEAHVGAINEERNVPPIGEWPEIDP